MNTKPNPEQFFSLKKIEPPNQEQVCRTHVPGKILKFYSC